MFGSLFSSDDLEDPPELQRAESDPQTIRAVSNETKKCILSQKQLRCFIKQTLSELFILQSSFPIRTRLLGNINVQYFEVKISGLSDELQAPGNTVLSIGFALDQFPQSTSLGSIPHSYGLSYSGYVKGYHLHSNRFCSPMAIGQVYGCGYIEEESSIFFTRNGELIGTAYNNIPRPPSSFHAVCTLQAMNQALIFNFGPIFKYRPQTDELIPPHPELNRDVSFSQNTMLNLEERLRTIELEEEKSIQEIEMNIRSLSAQLQSEQDRLFSMHGRFNSERSAIIRAIRRIIRVGQQQFETCDDDDHVCGICLRAPMDTLFAPCAHICSCYECALAIFKGDTLAPYCPYCRARIQSIYKIFKV